MPDTLVKENVVAESLGMKRVFNLVLRASWTDVPVFILGESGVGKEVVARAIHNTSCRAETGRFVQINCGAIPESLMESELFGYEPGAFTGANTRGKPGLFEAANHGTLLLDEIGDLPLSLQVKLLRVLQDREMYRVGGVRPIRLDVRIMAATNRNIWERMSAGAFREDLFYRLNVLMIEVPALRDRREDIVPLAVHFLSVFNEKYGLHKQYASGVLSIVERYDWPGNVRQLQNVVERLVVISEGDTIQAREVEAQLTDPRTTSGRPAVINEIMPLRKAREAVEKELIAKALRCYPSVRKAAQALGLDHATVLRKAAKYGITAERSGHHTS